MLASVSRREGLRAESHVKAYSDIEGAQQGNGGYSPPERTLVNDVPAQRSRGRAQLP